jgi:hypothetical protein
MFMLVRRHSPPVMNFPETRPSGSIDDTMIPRESFILERRRRCIDPTKDRPDASGLVVQRRDGIGSNRAMKHEITENGTA